MSESDENEYQEEFKYLDSVKLEEITNELNPVVDDVPRRFDPITFSKLSKYCYIENEYSCYESKGLCKSCKSIFEEKIIKVFGRNSLELNIELTETKKELLNLKSEFADLKKQITDILEKLNNDKLLISYKS